MHLIRNLISVGWSLYTSIKKFSLKRRHDLIKQSEKIEIHLSNFFSCIAFRCLKFSQSSIMNQETKCFQEKLGLDSD